MKTTIPSESFEITRVLKNTLILTVFLVSTTLCLGQTYNIGHTTKTFFDASRNRNIDAEIYYPATTSGDNVAISSGSFPVLIFGHGFVMSYSAYQNFWNELVPKGYILCFPKTEGSILPNHANFGNDLKYLATAMQSENDLSTSLFFNAVAPKTALMGHSMGGGASFLGAANNTNITTLINFAAAETNPSAITAAASVTVPTLIFSGDDDCVVPEAANQNLMYNNLASACKTQVKIINGGHCYYADYNFNCSLGELTCNSSLDITRAQQQAITFNFLNFWLSHYLYDDVNAETDFNNLLESSNQVNYSQSCTTLGNQEVLSPKDLKISPNPFENYINITMSELDLGGALKVINNLGQVVYTTQISSKESQINLSMLRDGFYIIHYAKDSFNYTGKFIKIGRKD